MAEYVKSGKENIPNEDLNGNLTNGERKNGKDKDNSNDEKVHGGHTKRLDFLLKQAEIFSHFMSNSKETQTTKPTFGKKQKNAGVPHRRARQIDDDDQIEVAENENAVGFRFEESPPYINGEMRDYQIRGLNWMISLYENNINGILADEMGLGKTIQTISLIGFLKHYKKIDGPHMVVLPLSTLRNWLNEFNRFCPSVDAFIFHGDAAQRKNIYNEKMQGSFDVLLTTYEICLLEIGLLKKIKWRYLVVDEAHRLKNENSKLSRFLRMLHTQNRLLLTGTPLQNNLHELWSLLNFLLPDVFNSSEDFDTWFDSNECLDDDNGVVKRLHSILKPFMLRRIKSEVEKSLLPKKEVKIFVGLTKMQREWYKNILLKNIETTDKFGVTGPKALNNILMHLRKCVNHPYLFEGAEPGPPYTTDEHIVNNCGKMIVLDKLLAKLKAQGSRVLIFSQFTTMLDLLEDYMYWRKYEYCRLDGMTDHETRTKSMEEYNAENSTKFVFMLSTRAGGLGINLVTADVVIIYDSDWNPQADLQAQDRAHRIGQKKQVRVFRLITENTVDEKIVERAEIKLRLDKMVIQQGRLTDNKSNQLSKDEKMQMIQYGAKYVLSSNESDITDEEIDKILERGEIKTAEQKAEYEKIGESGLRTLSLDTTCSVYNFEGIDFRAKRIENQVTIEGDILAESSRRVRLPVKYNFVPELKQAGPKVPKAYRVKQPVLYDFQFYPKKLHEIFEFERMTPLNERDSMLKEKYLAEGFSDWTRAHFKSYTDALIKFGRSDLENVSNHVQDKTPAEVIKYNEVFWKRGPELDRYKHIGAAIDRAELKRIEKKKIGDALNWKMAQYRRPLFELIIKNCKNDEFSKEQDRFLICKLHELNVNEPTVYSQLRSTILESPICRLDFYLRSRTSMELNKRCELLIRIILKEYEDAQSIDGRSLNAISDTKKSTAKAINKRRATTDDEKNAAAKKKQKP